MCIVGGSTVIAAAVVAVVAVVVGRASDCAEINGVDGSAAALPPVGAATGTLETPACSSDESNELCAVCNRFRALRMRSCSAAACASGAPGKGEASAMMAAECKADSIAVVLDQRKLIKLWDSITVPVYI